ncbi:mannose-sensitive hemagglutinin L [Sulfuricella denitrificans skB26]|uniref:Mannose-sensitive hemagglutinin L n=1 Tax=Sulfuricella denitrificans (strain DSM 22764 / NBRC 105220 / skB26) TaxID=1163617 RepID=S6AJF6_SULDS|nr:pilus (MSHA type) biogenesis protein MshL [Sulfuricella denitrificans]BAN36471.1 mannose-sensitive hemagglutinin L [Sulfuricella denitrificans skB26]
MRKAYFGLLILALSGCASQEKHGATLDQINAELTRASQDRAQAVQSDTLGTALLPPLKVEMPRVGGKPLEQKFDLVVNNAPASQVFMGIVNGTRYSMLIHPDVSGSVSVNLKDVTVFEALDAVREIYGYEYKVDGSRIYIQPLAMQTRIYKVNYLVGRRVGGSDTRVHSGSISSVPSTPGTSATGTTSSTSGGVSSSQDSSTIYTSTRNDFWGDLEDSVRTVIGCKMPTRSGGGVSTAGSGAQAGRTVETVSGRGVEGCDGGRSVVINPQSGVVLVRAMPAELRDVSTFLNASQLSVERQVILEAKILEVELSDGYQAGVNWGAFRTGSNSRLSTGNVSPGTVLQTSGPLATGATAMDFAARTYTNPVLDALPGVSMVTNPANVGGLFGLAFQTSNFAALIQFLETQGNVQVLSSPRIATLNNQKAVLKVGTDEFFVTNVSTTTTTGTSTTTTPSVTLQPFFSGIALDVTPQIDENNNITLHIHPSVSKVTTVNKVVDLGSAGSINLPLASSNISETDSIVRAQDGQIIAIGGLMKQATNDDRSQLPGAGDVPVLGNLFRNTNRSTVKRELVILLKPTVIQSDANWQQDILQSQQRIQDLKREQKVLNAERQ